MRTFTPDRTNPGGSRTITVKRACNGCGSLIGDATEAEIWEAINGPLSDVRAECPRCCGIGGAPAPAAPPLWGAG